MSRPVTRSRCATALVAALLAMLHAGAGWAEAPAPVAQGSDGYLGTDPGPEAWWGNAFPGVERFIALPNGRVTRPWSLKFVVDHRTNQPLQENPFHDFFGFDAGALRIGLGLRLGLIEGLDVGIYRLNGATDRFDVYELDARYQVLRQEAHHLDAAVRAGVTWFAQDDAADDAGALVQLLASRRFFDRVVVGTGLLFHSDSSNEVKSNLDTPWSLAVMLGLEVRILRRFSWLLEASYSVAGYGTRDKADVDPLPSFSTALQVISERHTFSLILSNNPTIAADGVVSNSPRDFESLIVGFQITREWNFTDAHDCWWRCQE